MGILSFMGMDKKNPIGTMNVIFIEVVNLSNSSIPIGNNMK